MTPEQIENLRRTMGTLPSQEVPLKTEYVKGVEGISVSLLDHNVNPYRAMYVLATSCWGSKIDKWEETDPEARFLVVKAILERQALPLALEVPNFTFAVEGISRAGFDQLARTRVGAVFSAKGMRDNNWKDASIRIPTSLWASETELDNFRQIAYGNQNYDALTEEAKLGVEKAERFLTVQDSMKYVKETYASIVDSGKASWQAARTVLPLYVVYGYSVCYNFAALSGVCRNRMKFCEMEDVVAVAWLMAREVAWTFPLLGNYLRPGCDFGHKCEYHRSYAMSEMFGCLFSECGRNPCTNNDGYAEFNETCTNYKDLEEQLGIHITRPDEWPEYTWENLPERDRILFIG